ncbi:MAG: hypothetical protein LW817_07210 [Candidatus Caenarcaniphilales bacterium]|jgi:hypothetical protein|nr:hypothetical protein [Candidatus Caenarcaniphilales bacterium]
MLFKKKEPAITVSKLIPDLKSIDDVLPNPRAWSPEALQEASNNLKFTSSRDIDPIENLTVQFLFRKFFTMMHQTGLYNPQKRLWSLLALAKQVELKEYKKLSKKQKELAKVTDIIISDIYGKFIVARLVHPGCKLDYPGFNDLFSKASHKCIGLFYISDLVVTETVLTNIWQRTNNNHFFDKYRSPIGENTSFNLIRYQPNQDSLTYTLVHPNLGKDATVNAMVRAQELEAFEIKASVLV